VLVAMLRESGLDVIAADQPMLALHQAGPGIGMIISDLDLPGMHGLQLLALLRQRCGPDTPAIAISASVETVTAVQAREAGFDVFLPKPVTRAALRDALQTALATRA
jgi:CheY-like chemotaxis protein